MDEEKLKKAKQKNVKLYPIYKLFAWDLLFYYSIYFLFLSQVKGLTAATIVFGNGFYTVFKLLFQPFAPTVVNILGKRKSTILGNILVTFSILYIILAPPSLLNLIIFNLINSLGYILKGVCEAGILDECITNNEKKRSTFAKIDGKGSAYWYIFEAISSVSTGFLFVINGYIPMYLCFIFCIIGTILSAKFEHYEVNKKIQKEKFNLKEMINKIDLSKQEYLFIFKSKRLRALLLFSGLFYGILYIRSTLTSSLLVDIGIPDKYFGIIVGSLTVFAAITTWKQNVFHKKFRNKVLTVFAITYSSTLIVIGIVVTLNINYQITVFVSLIMMIVQNMIKGPYYTLIKRYLNSFSNERISTKIYSINNIIEGVCGTLISFLVSILLEYTTTAYTSLFLGIIILILFIIILDYMKTRIGLKPEEYNKQDIEFQPKLKKAKEPIKNEIEISISVDENGENKIEIET